VKDKVPLILRTSDGISNLMSQGGVEEVVNTVELWQEILNHRGLATTPRAYMNSISSFFKV
jgi:hypothetical protein